MRLLWLYVYGCMYMVYVAIRDTLSAMPKDPVSAVTAVTDGSLKMNT
jgi:hypothetical protein